MLTALAAAVPPATRHLVEGARWGVLVLMALSLATQFWYGNEWAALALLAAALLLWSPKLRSGASRWWFVYVAGVFVYTLLRALADDWLFPVRTDYVVNIERALFLGTEPVVWVQSRLFSPTDIDFIDVLATQVHWSFFVIPHALAVAIYIRRPDLFSRYVARILGVQYAGLVLFFLVPTAPPWLAAEYGEIEYVYRVMNFVGRSVDPETYRTLYSALGEPNDVAAVPSIHMAVTVAAFLWVRRFAPTYAPFFALYSVLMAVSLVHLAEHYVFDLLVGTLLAVAADLLLRRVWPDPESAVAPSSTEPATG